MNERFPLVTAHTGCAGMREHSFASLHAALKLGADVYEDDIRVTRDGRLVLFHDDEVLLRNGQNGSVSGMSLTELTEALPEPPTLLEDALRLVIGAGKTMNLDIKTPDSLGPVFALIDRMNAADRVFLSGCEYPVAAEADRFGRHVRKLLNVNIDSFRNLSYEEAAEQACRESLAAGCFGLNVPYQLVCPELLVAAALNQLAVYVWTVSEKTDMNRMADMGVTSITTRDVAALMTVKAAWNLRRRGCIEQ